MVTLSDIKREFSEFTLGPVNLAVPAGSFFMLMGPTGSGKTLVLETVAGLSRPDSGTVVINDRDVTAVKTGKRGVGIVYQDSALFPHLTVQENIEYGLKWGRRGISVERIVQMLDLGEILHRMPGKLSGGEKQRTALARALVTGPEVILLDEPMSSLDPHFRGRLRSELRDIHSTTGTTFIMATHDFSDALSLGTSGAVMNNGRIEQQGVIDDIFFKPATPFMATFVGMRNVIPVQFRDGKAFTCCGQSISFMGNPPGSSGHIAVSPDSINISDGELRNADNSFSGKITGISRDGYGFLAEVITGSLHLWVSLTPHVLEPLRLRENDSVWLSWDKSAVHTF